MIETIRKYQVRAIIFLFLQCLAACSEREEGTDVLESVPAMSPLVAQVSENYKNINNSAAVVYSEEIKGDRTQKRLVRSVFSRPWLLRNEIVAGTEPADAGSEAIYDGGEKITGHKGGMMSFATVSLYYDSPMITTLLGFTFREMVMEAMLGRLFLYEQLGTIEIGEDVQTGLGAATTLHLRLPKNVSLPDHDRVQALGATHEEVYIDKSRVLPVGWAIYVGEIRVRMLVFESLLTDAELDSDIFRKVRLEKEQYEALDRLMPPLDWRPDHWQTVASGAGAGS